MENCAWKIVHGKLRVATATLGLIIIICGAIVASNGLFIAAQVTQGQSARGRV
ncbi:MAG: hypothetical protein GDA48_12920 [Hormoscilla sp. GM102CHS1]|nr:hypothetical protein [Hormoscilla sp. GM102CHS1]